MNLICITTSRYVDTSNYFPHPVTIDSPELSMIIVSMPNTRLHFFFLSKCPFTFLAGSVTYTKKNLLFPHFFIHAPNPR